MVSSTSIPRLVAAVLVTWCSIVTLIATTASAQMPKFQSRTGDRGNPFSRLGGRTEKLKISSSFTVHEPSGTGTLSVKLDIGEHLHVYSVSQKPGGTIPSRITIEKSDQYERVGDFKPDKSPKVIELDIYDVPLEEHEGTVIWTAPIRFASDADFQNLTIPLKYKGQVCSTLPNGDLGECELKNLKSTAKFESLADAAAVAPEQAEAWLTANKTPQDSSSDANDTSSDEGSNSSGGGLPLPTGVPPVPESNGEPSGTGMPSPPGGSTDNGNDDSASTTEVEGQILANVDTPESIVEMAKLYNANSKINYVTLGDTGETTLLTALFGAFVGGFLLNLMPCVFPVLGIKVMGFVQQADSEPRKIRLHGLAFTAGLVASMWVLAGFILALKLVWGQEVNWGQQMGNSYFVAAMIVLLFLLGLNMAGVFEIGTSLTRLGGVTQGKKGYSSSFLSGVLTTLIATPCSGPFLGAAMGYTLGQPAGIAMILFTVFALGISLPYLILSMFPSLIHKLPRPGAWMETFKVTMAFLLFATVAWFMQTFGSQTGADGLSWLAMALVVLALAAYFYGHWSQPHLAAKTRYTWGLMLPLVIAGIGLWMTYDAAAHTNHANSSLVTNSDGVAWRPWRPGIVEHTTGKKNRVVFVDYTADW